MASITGLNLSLLCCWCCFVCMGVDWDWTAWQDTAMGMWLVAWQTGWDTACKNNCRYATLHDDNCHSYNKEWSWLQHRCDSHHSITVVAGGWSKWWRLLQKSRELKAPFQLTWHLSVSKEAWSTSYSHTFVSLCKESISVDCMSRKQFTTPPYHFFIWLILVRSIPVFANFYQ